MLFDLQNVSVRLSDSIVLQDIDWQIESGKSWIVMGANGSGKSTLAKLLLGKLPNFKGRVYNNLLHNDIAYVGFEHHQSIIKQELITQESNYFAGKEESVIANPVQQSTQCVEIQNSARDGKGKQSFTTLSAGESRKELIERAFQKNPKLLILDEPFDGLDINSRVSLKEYLEKLIKNVTLILITHREDEFIKGINNFLVLEEGRIKNKLENASSIPVTIDKSYIKNKSFPKPDRSNRRIIINMKAVNVRYGNKIVFRDFSWKVRQGENWLITGPNGSGKSTLLKLITGDIPQVYANEIKILGKKLGKNINLWDLKSKIGIVSPEIQLNYLSNLTGFEVVISGLFDSIGLYKTATRRDKLKVSRLAREMGIEDLIEKDYLKLSNGQKRLILIARALIKSPKIVIMDEPTTSLDPANRQKVLNLILSLANSNTTLLLVSHYPSEELDFFKKLNLYPKFNN